MSFILRDAGDLKMAISLLQHVVLLDGEYTEARSLLDEISRPGAAAGPGSSSSSSEKTASESSQEKGRIPADRESMAAAADERRSPAFPSSNATSPRDVASSSPRTGAGMRERNRKNNSDEAHGWSAFSDRSSSVSVTVVPQTPGEESNQASMKSTSTGQFSQIRYPRRQGRKKSPRFAPSSNRGARVCRNFVARCSRCFCGGRRRCGEGVRRRQQRHDAEEADYASSSVHQCQGSGMRGNSWHALERRGEVEQKLRESDPAAVGVSGGQLYCTLHIRFILSENSPSIK